MALTNSQPNNISVPNGNGLVVYIDGLTNQVYVRDVKGSIEELNVLTESITTIIATGGLTQLKEGSVVTLGTDSTIIQLKAEKGQPNGYASLDASGKLPVSELPVSVLTYEGLWNAATNTPTLADGVGDAGDFYIVSVGGVQDLGSGPIRFEEGDWVIYSGSVWQENSSQIPDLQEVTDVGATTTNAITTGGITTDYVQLDLAATPTLSVGMARWNTDQLTWEVGLGTGPIAYEMGQSLFYPQVRNTSGTNLPKGTLVMVDPTDVSTGDRLNVVRAVANGTYISQLFVGILAEAINSNATGFAVWFGQIYNIANSAINLGGEAWVEGDILYASAANPGGLTKVEPAAPNLKVTIAAIQAINGGNVNLLVRPWLNEDIGQLNDVSITNPDDNSILQFNSTTGVWEDVAGTTTNIAEGTNLYFTTARARESVSATDGLAYNSSTGVFTNIDKGSSQDIFKNIAVATQSTVTADTNNDTLTLAAGTNIAITTNATTDTITIATTGVPTGTGVANYLALWTSSSNLGTSLIYDNGTNIGINTATPFSDGANTNSLTIQGLSGSAIQLQTNNVSGLKMSTTAAGSLAGDVRNLNFDLVANNAAKLGVLATGTIRLYDYGTGAKTGTPTFNLFVDANGNIIEGPGGVIDGSGTTNFVAKFTDANTIGNSTIFDNGTSVGIGTITPIGLLDLFKSAAATRLVINGDAGQNKIITYRVGGLQRFGLYVNNTAEAGANAGSDFAIRAYADAGTILSTPFFIKRATGNIVLNSTTDAGFKLDVHGTSKFRLAATFDTDITVNGLIVGRSGGNVSSNVAIGPNALDSNTTGSLNTAVGENALTTNTASNNNSAFGASALQNNTGGNNTAVGRDALKLNTSASNNTAVGFNALSFNTTGNENAALGKSALESNTTGVRNSAVGFNALYANTTGLSNAAFGHEALRENINGSSNSALGKGALQSNTSGSANTAVGNSAMGANQTGQNNSVLGVSALFLNSSGSSNSAMGREALFSNSTGSNNAAIGFQALYNNTTGANNIALGSTAGKFLANGSTSLTITNNSVFLGVDSRANADNETNQIVIGHLAIGGGSNSVVIGNSSITSNRFFGTMRVGTINNGVGDFITTDANGVLTKRTAAETRTDIGAGTGDGSVTSVAMTVPTGFAIGGTPITVSGTLGLTFAAGYSLPTDARQTEWDNSYNDSITAFAYNTGTALLTLTQRDLGTLTATITLQPFSTTNLAEGTNLYYTDVRVRLALSAGTGISYNNTTGVITNSDLGSSQNIFKNFEVAGQSTVIADTNNDTLTLVAGTNISITTNATTDTITINSTDQFVGTVTSVAMSAPTGFAISGSPITTSGTLGLSFASGYSLPTDAIQADWTTSYNRSLTAFAYNTSTGALTLTKQDTTTLIANVTLAPFSTTNLAEGTNLYYTDTRVRLALSAGTGISYDNATGVISNSDRGSSQNIFKNIAITGSELVVADTNDDTVTFTAGAGVTITSVASTDTITISATGLGGTVTSVGLTAPTGFSVSGSPVTTSGTITLAFAAGYALPTTASQANWDDAYNNKITAVSFNSGTLTLTQQDTGTLTTSLDGRYILLSEKAAVNGVATLDSSGKIPSSQLPSSVFEYKGLWNAATNTPTLADGTGDPGDVYQCNVAGTVNFGSGPVTFAVGDLVIYDGTEWQKSDSTTEVESVNGQTGVVVLTTTNIGEGTNLYFTDARARTAISGGTGISYNNTTGTITNSDLGSSQNIFKNFDVAGQSTVSADTNNDTLTLVAGTNISITTNATTDTITINSTDQFVGTVTSVGMSAPTGFTVSGTPVTSSGTLGLAFAAGYSLPTDAIQADWTTSYNRSLTAFAYNTSTGALTLTKQDTTTLIANVTLAPFSTTNLAEGTNLYFTDARARTAISGGTGISYNNTTGTITNSDLGSSQNIFKNFDVAGQSTVSADTNNDTLTLVAGTNITITTNATTDTITINSTDQFVGTVTSVAMSVPTGFAISGSPITTSGTLGVSFASGYSLPTDAIQADWTTSYNRSLTAFAYNTSTGALTLTKQDTTTLIANVTLAPFSTTNLAEGTNLYFTDARVRTAIALTTSGTSGAATYNNTTGVFNIPQYQAAITNPVTGTGTTNYVPKWTSASAIGDSQIFDSGTFVGIGTASPAAELQVNKASDVTIAMSNSTAVTSGNRGTLAFYNSGVSTVAIIRAAAVTDNVGTELQFHTRPAAGSVTQQMTITSTGNVGIGTTAPVLKLDINGAAGSPGLGATTGMLKIGQTSATGFLTIGAIAGGSYAGWIQMSDGAGSQFPLALQAAGGNVGIGTASPANSRTVIVTSGSNANEIALALMHGDGGLDVNQEVQMNFGQGSNASVALAQIGAAYTGGSFNGALVFRTNSTSLIEGMRLTSGGNLLIGTATDSGYKLDVNGTSRFSSLITSTGSAEQHIALLSYNSTYVKVRTNAGFNSNYNNLAIIVNTNISDTAQGNATLPSWALNLGGNLPDGDSYTIERSAAGSFSFSKLLKLSGNGALQLNSYGAGTITGTPAYNLGVDASGNVIELPGGVVDGSGTANTITKWQDANTVTNSSITDDGTTITATAANFVSQSNLGTAYTSFSTSGTTAIFDTITRTNSAIYQIVIVANPNSAGSGSYADFYYGKVFIGTGFNGSAVVEFINYHQESPMPRTLYGSGGGDLTVTAVMLVGGTEFTEIAVNTSYTIRIKIAGYVVAGTNTTVRLQRIM
jgi:hypothetical protein